MDISAMNEAIIPTVGRTPPISTPNTNADPINPRATPIHCFHPTCSLRKGPAKAFVKIGCIVTMQPILTNALAGPFLKEHVGWKQWIGVALGFIGSALVLGVDIGGALPTIGIVASFIALISITSATLFQKKFSGNIPLPVSNTYQAAGGCFFHLVVILFFVEPFIYFNPSFLIAMGHQIFLVSFGAFTILMFLIKNNSASKTVTVFFLIPATSAIIAWIFLNEQLSLIDIFGFIVASLGVFIATRKS